MLGVFFIPHQLKINVSQKDKAEVKQEVKTLPKEIKEELTQANPEITFRVPILLYHYVEYVTDKNDATRLSLSIYPYTFERQLQTLQNNGYTFMTAGELADVLDDKTILPKKPIVLTFDDGYRDFYTDVFPLLKKYHAKATAYIVPGFIDNLNYMYSFQLEEVAKSGLVEIGAHTMHHVYLKNDYLTDETVSYEVEESKKALEEKLSMRIVSFAYPYGAFDQRAIEVVKKAGFKTAVSTVPGSQVSRENRFFVFRIRPGKRIEEELLHYLEQSPFKPY